MNIKIQPNPGRTLSDDIVRPAGVREYHGMFGGYDRSWKEYVPSCYDGSKKVPLVVSLHGGAGHSAEIRFAWELIAERENFIVLYPQCIVEGITWNTLEEPNGPNDVAYIDELIQQTIGKYAIDETRIYMQGQSMGDLMTSTYICRHPERIAAAAPLSGPGPASKYMNPDGSFHRYPDRPLTVIRTHGSEDLGLPVSHSLKDAMKPKRPKEQRRMPVMWMNSPVRPPEPKAGDEQREKKLKLHLLLNDYIWKTRNATPDLPKISVDGRYAWFFYEGPEADYIFYSVQDGEHVLAMDMAELVWDNVFSKYSRVDGKTVRGEAALPVRRDVGAVALADGALQAYVNNELVEIGDAVPLHAHFVNDSYYVPVSFIPKAFPGLSVRMEDNGMTAYISGEGHELQVAVGMCVSVFDNRLSTQNRAIFIDSNLYVAISDIAEKFYGWTMCMGRGAAYVGPKATVMSFDLAYHIRRILGMEPPWTVQDMIAMEQEIVAGKPEMFGQNMTPDERPLDPEPEKPARP